jgi:decaprenyl-phosphate phosphoribosyltransferase
MEESLPVRPTKRRLATALLVTMRPHQWVKNFFVLVPLVFAQKLGESWDLTNAETPLARTAIAFGLFCLSSGLVYLLNDLVDKERDRAHPKKKFRPIASGELPMGAAAGALTVGLVVVEGLAVAVSPKLAAVLSGYILLNVAYSFRLKNIVFVDICSISTGFLLRVLGGAIAAGVPVTYWLYACTFLLACFLALGKRKHELCQLGAETHKTRQVLSRYKIKHVDAAILLTGLLTGVCYSAYCFSEHAIGQFGTRNLGWTIPFILFGFWRFITLVKDADESPTEAMIRDPLFLLNLVLWGCAVGGVIYG